MSTSVEKKNTGDLVDLTLQEIFELVFRISDLRDEVSIETTDSWDSMGHMELMAAIEESFNIRIDPEDIINLTSFSAIKKYLEERL